MVVRAPFNATCLHFRLEFSTEKVKNFVKKVINLLHFS